MTGRRTITQARGDVTGDGIPDRVWLSGPVRRRNVSSGGAQSRHGSK